MSDNSNVGCSSCLVWVALIVLAIIFVPKFFDNTEEITDNTEQVKKTEKSIKNEVENLATDPEYAVDYYLKAFKENTDKGMSICTNSFYEDMAIYVKEMENTDLVKDTAASYYFDLYGKVIFEFTYQVYPVEYKSEEKVYVTADINYTDFVELLEKSIDKCIEHAINMDKLGREVSIYGEALNIGKYAEELYPEHKNKHTSKLTFTVIKVDDKWMIDGCDDTKAMFNALYAGIFEEFSEQYKEN